MLVVGLTGGIGSGKSTAAEALSRRGAEVIDADAVARAVVRPGRPALGEIRERFGPDVVTGAGRLDRPALARIVFDDPEARGDLEAITHPRISAAIEERLAALEDDEPRVVVVDHPLLVETGQAGRYPVVVVVEAPRPVRRDRLVRARGMRPADVEARMEAQATDAERRAVATHVLDNSGDRDALEEQVDRLWDELARRAGGEAA